MFSYEALVADVRAAATRPEPIEAIRAVLHAAIADPAAIRAVYSETEDDEVCLFEDESLSIWRCRFQPTEFLPPHEHKLPVLIAAYSGAEESTMYRREANKLKKTGTLRVRAGEVTLLDEDAIHSVTALDDQPSDAFHVYMGPLMSLKRDLFDWDTGRVVQFTMENFHSMIRPKG